MKRLRSGGGSPREKKLREIAGIHACREVLRVRPNSVGKIWLKQGWESAEQLAWFADQAQRRRIKLETVPLKKLDELCWGHQGVACFSDQVPQFDFEAATAKERSCILFLDGIVDPQNLGAMIRTAWLMEVGAIYLPKDRAAGLTAAVCKVASGGVEHIPLVFENNFVQVLKQLKTQGFWIYGLTEHESENIYNLQFPEKVAWVVGAEEKGIRGGVLKECDVRVRIPQADTGSSYNASVALGIALSETVRPYKIRT